MAPLALVAGNIAASYRNGGIAWERLCWALGLRRIGFEILLVDQLDRWRCVYDDTNDQGYERCLNIDYFEHVIDAFDLTRQAALVGDGGESLYGPSSSELLERAEAAEMLVNVAGDLRLDEVKRRSRLAVYVDVDPGLTHLRLASGEPAPRVEGHDLHFTIGENVGTAASPLPTVGVKWRHTRQPVLLDEWPSVGSPQPSRFTTVATWRGVGPHGRLETVGHVLSQKGDEFEKVIELPRRADGSFELALRLRPDDELDRMTLERRGWRVVDAATVAFDPDAFRSYVQGSGAEFSVAKGAYVETRSGWFSDRTTRYLASGKPALVQDTGFGQKLPLGDGLLAFRGLDEAVDGANRIIRDYAHHSKAARAVAEDYFDSDKVLARFADEVEAAARSLKRRREA